MTEEYREWLTAEEIEDIDVVASETNCEICSENFPATYALIDCRKMLAEIRDQWAETWPKDLDAKNRINALLPEGKRI